MPRCAHHILIASNLHCLTPKPSICVCLTANSREPLRKTMKDAPKKDTVAERKARTVGEVSYYTPLSKIHLQAGLFQAGEVGRRLAPASWVDR